VVSGCVPVGLGDFVFLTLNFNHTVLYAPSDFVNEENFLRSFRRASPLETARKLNEEVAQIEATLDVQQDDDVPRLPIPEPRAVAASYRGTEDFAFSRLQQELDITFDREVAYGGGGYIFDGIAISQNEITAVEVLCVAAPAYAGRAPLVRRMVKRRVDRMVSFHQQIPIQGNFSLILAVVFDVVVDDLTNMIDEARKAIGITPFLVDVRGYRLPAQPADKPT
jgi:hypothetical protein